MIASIIFEHFNRQQAKNNNKIPNRLNLNEHGLWFDLLPGQRLYRSREGTDPRKSTETNKNQIKTWLVRHDTMFSPYVFAYP